MTAGKRRSRRAVEAALAVLSAGGTLHEARAASGLPVSFLFQLDAHRRRRGPPLSARERRKIERLLGRGRMSQRAIAREVRRAASTVNRVARLVELATGRKRFRRLKKPRRCQRHGWVRLWPCVACEAEADAERGTRD